MFYIFLFKNKENIFVFSLFYSSLHIVIGKMQRECEFSVCWYTLPHWGFCPPGTGEVKGV